MTGSFTRWRGHAWLGLAARVYLGVVFLAACAYKIMHPDSFAVDVATYGILPLGLVNIFALVIPWVEALAGALLIIGLRVRAASLLIAGMMAMFMIALAIALGKGLDMSCGCFASAAAQGDDPIGWSTMARDGVWLALALYVLVMDRRPIGLDRIVEARRKQ